MFPEVERVLIDRARIAARVGEIAQDIARDLQADLAREDRQPGPGSPGGEGRVVLIPIMTGAMIFTADLVRHMPIKLSLGLIAVSSYPGASVESRGAKLTEGLSSQLPADLAGKHVVIIDDILDSGRTLDLVSRVIADRHPASLRTAVLLDKPARRAVHRGGSPLRADYVGFEIPDHFVVGYGLDFDGYYRNHPDIVVLRPGVLTA
jgi:hypoxanthine phosphoribosyltransferase